MSLLHWGAQNWTPHSRCGLTSAEQRGRISSLNLLATILLMQLRIPFRLIRRAHCCLMLNLVPTRTPPPSGSYLLSAGLALACPGAWDCSTPGAALCISLSRGCCWPISPARKRFLKQCPTLSLLSGKASKISYIKCIFPVKPACGLET